ncbi:LysR substrate-binding domain-containing protein [Burkholderia sp. BCC0397]|uniref:LysR substrate-binding domain-containing protein n=1 Tax=Burkholderia sp. BCC0397 TaxID=486876 RepID=UPI00158B56DC|nr:LysR substrate-binding domain-containing protein [Burkholderia sp. BCC0397]
MRFDAAPFAQKKPGAGHINGTFCSDNGEVLREWCVAGLGISLRETWDVHDDLRSGQLVRVLPEWEGVASKISLVRARREPVPRRLTASSDFLVARWQQAPLGCPSQSHFEQVAWARVWKQTW